jgi:hypothetical protein
MPFIKKAFIYLCLFWFALSAFVAGTVGVMTWNIAALAECLVFLAGIWVIRAYFWPGHRSEAATLKLNGGK